jgi:hypothetical protein
MSVTKPPAPRRAGRLRVLLAVALAVTLCVAALAGWWLGSDGAKQTGRPDLQRIPDDVVTGRDRLAPGATAFVSGPRGTWLGSAGVDDITTREPMRSGARMRLQSISQIYTAALMLQLGRRDVALAAQLRSVCSETPNSSATCLSGVPARISSTAWRRNSGAYGGRVLGIWTSSLPEPCGPSARVSTEPGQLHPLPQALSRPPRLATAATAPPDQGNDSPTHQLLDIEATQK